MTTWELIVSTSRVSHFRDPKNPHLHFVKIKDIEKFVLDRRGVLKRK